MVVNNQRLCSPYNAEEPPESLIKRLNDCADFATTASKTVSKTQLFRIAYSLVAETR